MKVQDLLLFHSKKTPVRNQGNFESNNRDCIYVYLVVSGDHLSYTLFNKLQFVYIIASMFHAFEIWVISKSKADSMKKSERSTFNTHNK